MKRIKSYDMPGKKWERVLRRRGLIPEIDRVAQSAEAQKRRCTKILVLDENLDPQHTLFCREISFVANYAL